jgi:hypothetical protein
MKDFNTSERRRFASAVKVALSRTAGAIPCVSDSPVLLSVTEDTSDSLSELSARAACHIRVIMLAFNYIPGSVSTSS